MHLGRPESLKRENTSASGMWTLQNAHWSVTPSSAFLDWVCAILPLGTMILVLLCTEKPPKVANGVSSASHCETIVWLIRWSNLATRIDWWIVRLTSSNCVWGCLSKCSCLNIELSLLTVVDFLNKFFFDYF